MTAAAMTTALLSSNYFARMNERTDGRADERRCRCQCTHPVFVGGTLCAFPAFLCAGSAVNDNLGLHTTSTPK